MAKTKESSKDRKPIPLSISLNKARGKREIAIQIYVIGPRITPATTHAYFEDFDAFLGWLEPVLCEWGVKE